MVELSWLTNFMPLYAFIISLVIIFAVLTKTKLFENNMINFIISLIFSIIFITFVQSRDFIISVILGFSVLIILAFFMLIVLYFISKDPEPMLKPISYVFLAALIIIIIVALFSSFPSISAYIPGNSESTGDPSLLSIKHFLMKESVYSTITLVIAASIVGYILLKKTN